jgi:non-specific serine/threonine protein kinase
MGEGRGSAAALTGLAGVAAAGQPQTAVRLLAAAHTALGPGPERLDQVNEETYERTLAVSRARLREPTFAAAWREGLAWSPEQAVDATRRASHLPHGGLPHGPVPAVPAATPLTPRQREVAALVGQGLTNREIAARLTITEHTAENHIVNILNKLGVRSRVQIATWATTQGLVPQQA